jgi:nucleotide-binding universal stress UspA family protein
LIKKILVATDGSVYAEHALNFALDLAYRYSAEIELVTVVPPVLLPAHSFNVVKSEAIADATLQLENSFKGALTLAEEKARKEKPNLKVYTAFEHGNPDEKIVETAKRGNFDIIIMGSRGLGNREYSLGSISHRVADNSPCPVLIVK